MNGLKIASVLTFAAGIVFFTTHWAGESHPSENQTFPDEESVEIGEYNVLPGISSGNLQVFLIEGEAELGNKNYIPLSTAMEEEMVVVKETGSVNELSIDNKSDEYIFIHSGDIVKGGKQDRTMAYDVIIPPNAQDVALQSFCVESGRWEARENEAVDNFNSTTKMLSSRDLKMAAKYDNDQSKVWSNVSQEQQKLNYNVSVMNGYDVDLKDGVSATSLQLTLESEELEKAKSEMEEAFANLLIDHPNAVGFAYAINGEIYGVDIYNNRVLFEEIWERVVESIVIEAISNKSEEPFEYATANAVTGFMSAVAESDQKTNNSRAINKTTDLSIDENEDGDVVFSTVDNDENQWLHKNYMKVNPNNTVEDIYQFNNELNIDNIIQEQR